MINLNWIVWLANDSSQHTLLLCEHDPVYTSGRRITTAPPSLPAPHFKASHHDVAVKPDLNSIIFCNANFHSFRTMISFMRTSWRLHQLGRVTDHTRRWDDVPRPWTAGGVPHPQPQPLHGTHRTHMHPWLCRVDNWQTAKPQVVHVQARANAHWYDCAIPSDWCAHTQRRRVGRRQQNSSAWCELLQHRFVHHDIVAT